MPITELATLQLKPCKDWKDILPHARIVELEQAAWSGYALLFFDVPDRPGEIILLSGWQSVDAHPEWIASETNKNLLQSLLPSLDVTSLLHLTVEPSQSLEDAQAVLYEKADGGKLLGDSITFKDIIWEGEGVDAEGKVKGTFRLVAFNNTGTVGHFRKGNGEFCWFVRHNISPA